MTRVDMLRRYPFYSVDSSSCSSCLRFPSSFTLFDEALGKWVSIDLSDPRAILANSRLLDAHELSARDALALRVLAGRSRRLWHTLRSWQRFADWCAAKGIGQRA